MLVPFVLWFIGGVLQDRFFQAINAYLDEHAAEFISRIRPMLTFKGSLGLPIGVFRDSRRGYGQAMRHAGNCGAWT